jgi:phosphohistidine phosphatase SixA
MTPRFVLVTRHAEKANANPTSGDLSPDGRARAERLASYLPSTFGAPAFIFSSAISKHSARPYQTVEPLSKSVGVPIDATIADHDYEVLAHDLLTNPRYVGAGVVICWHHGNIPSLMHALGAKAGTYPDPWERAVFDLILELDYPLAGPPNVTRITEPF